MKKKWVILCLIIIGFGGALWIQPKMSMTSAPFDYRSQAELMKILLSALPHYQSLWMYGPSDELLEKLDCEQFHVRVKNLSTPMKQCQPDLFRCALEYMSQKSLGHQAKYHQEIKHVIPIPIKQNEWAITKLKSQIDHLRLSERGIQFRLALRDDKNFFVDLFLEDSCRSTLLPQRKYKQGSKLLTTEGYYWDNLHREIYVDKKLVTYRDLYNWSKLDLKQTEVEDNLDLAAAYLNLDQMKMYCAQNGKQLLQSHIYDAATNLPINTQTQYPQYIINSPTPWTHREKMTFYHSKKIDCKKAFVDDCQDSEDESMIDARSATWIEMYQSKGLPFEYTSETQDNENINLSSYYIDSHSSLHQNGLRAWWNGLTEQKDSFKFGIFSDRIKDRPYYKVVFRCMEDKSY